MSGYPKITVITPSYNQGQFIEETIKSILDQNYPNLEYIIIDGGSDDETVDIIKRYENRISYWVSEEDNGQSDAINKGLKKATGDIVCWLNSDDLFLDDTLIYIAEYFTKNPNISFVYGDGVVFYDDESRKEKLWVPERRAVSILPEIDLIQQPSSFWRRDVHDNIGYLDEELYYTMDWDLFLRISNEYKMVYLNKVFSRYRIHAAHKTGNPGERKGVEVLRIAKIYASPEWNQICEIIYPQRKKILFLRKYLGVRLSRIVFLALSPSLLLRFGWKVTRAVHLF